jgi:elongation factor Ts
MASVSTADIKRLREATGAGMTDFVAKSAKFTELAQSVADAAFGINDATALQSVEVGGKPLSDVLNDANASMGEKIEVRRVATFEGAYVASYLHRTNPDLPPQLGVLVELSGENAEIAKDVAQHIAAFAPTYVSRTEVPEDVVAKEREIAEATAKEEGKPEAALPKIVEGRVNGFFKESVLLEQAFAKDNKKTVGKVLEEAGVQLTGFVRFKVGQA